MTDIDAYRRLESRFGRLGRIGNALGILNWDQHTIMPDGGAEARAETVAALEVLSHDILTDARAADDLDAADADTDRLDAWQQANLREMRRSWRHATALTPDLVEANAKAIARCEMAWRSAREESNFAALLPSQSEVLRLQREIAERKSERLGVAPFDALLDEYEPGARAERIDALFDDLAAFLPGFTEAVLEQQAARHPVERPEGPFPVADQRAVAERLMAAVGFDFSRGRLDVSLHPFCGGATDDVRITTRYDESDFVKALMGVLHETGHAMYEQGLPAAWHYQPVGEARGLALHESQSLIIEMQACRSREFLAFAAPILREVFKGDGAAWDLDNLHRLYTQVERGFIRVDADEVTYPAHVILRYRLERAMLGGDLALSDLPGAWNEGMQALVGVTPPNDRLGCLQDIHWPGGAWAYFPTYTLGAMAAAQLFDAACRDGGDVESGLARGDFQPLMGWLRSHVHSQGSLHDTDALLTRATGAPLSTDVFKAHLKRRYLDA